MKLIEVKCEQPFFDMVWSGKKSFEIRLDDREYRVGYVSIRGNGIFMTILSDYAWWKQFEIELVRYSKWMLGLAVLLIPFMAAVGLSVGNLFEGIYAGLVFTVIFGNGLFLLVPVFDYMNKD